MGAESRINVTRSSMPPFEEYCNEIRELWDTRILTNRGAKHKQLEEKIQKYLGVEHITLFVNGHSALECVLECLELGADGRDEVITTPFTFASTTHAIVRKGLKPVFCDIRPDDYTMNPEAIERLITNRTCAIVPVHVYGNVCDVGSIKEIADRHGLKVVYDAAHAFGVKVNGVGVGNYGDASMFSFHATKVFNTIEGGAIAHPNGDLSEKLAQWRNFGIMGPEEVVYVGGNSKMNEFAAAMGLCNLRHVDGEIAKRAELSYRYREVLGDVKGLRLNQVREEITSNYAYMPIVIDPLAFGASRDDVFKTLRKQGVFSRKYFYPLTSEYECYRGQFCADDTPVAKRVSECVITLPLFAGLPVGEVDRICAIVKACAS